MDDPQPERNEDQDCYDSASEEEPVFVHREVGVREYSFNWHVFTDFDLMVECAKYLEGLVVTQSQRTIRASRKGVAAVYADQVSLTISSIRKKAWNNQIKILEGVFNIPDGVTIPNGLAHFVFQLVFALDCDSSPKFIHFFVDRGCKFCWHHLKPKHSWKESEQTRLKINKSICEVKIQTFCGNAPKF